MPSSRFTWHRPTTHIYSYNREAQNIFNERSRASSVTASASTSNIMSRTARAASVAESSSDHFKSKTTTTTERTSSAKFDAALEQQRSLEYGKQSKSRALRRAELHAVHSGKDPRHTVLPRSLGDDICKVVADLHVSPYESRELSTAKAASMQGRVKVEKMEKELSKLTENAMAYKSIYAKSARQMAHGGYA